VTFAQDLLERCLRTFIAAALATALAGLAGVSDLTTAKALGMSAITTGITAVVGLLGKFVGEPDSASFWRK